MFSVSVPRFFFNLNDAVNATIAPNEIIIRREQLDKITNKPTKKNIWYIVDFNWLSHIFKKSYPHNLFFHEVISTKRMCNFFVDFDKSDFVDKKPYLDSIEFLKSFIGMNIRWFQEDSSTEKKISKHLKTSDIHFKNPYHIGFFLAEAVMTINKTNPVVASNLYWIIDWGLYSRVNPSLRMYYCSKLDDITRRLVEENNRDFDLSKLVHSLIGIVNNNSRYVEYKTEEDFGSSKMKQTLDSMFGNQTNGKKKSGSSFKQSDDFITLKKGQIPREIRDNIIDFLKSFYSKRFRGFDHDFDLYQLCYKLNKKNKYIEYLNFHLICHFCPLYEPKKQHKIPNIRTVEYLYRENKIRIGCLFNPHCKGKQKKEFLINRNEISNVLRKLHELLC